MNQLEIDFTAQESWLPIQVFPDYSVSDLGRIRNDKRKRVLRPGINSRGYLQVKLYNETESKVITVHKLVLCAFVGQPSPGQECLHGPNGKQDNRLISLRWDSHQANVAECVMAKGEEVKTAKLTNADAVEIKRQLTLGVSGKVLAARYGVTHRTISAIKCGVQWSHIPWPQERKAA